MDLAWISLGALVLVIVVSCTTELNPGFLAIVLAWIIGIYVAPWMGTTIGVKAVLAGFPIDLFLTLVGVTLLFSLAQTNGTLDRVAQVAVRACRGNAGTIPLIFFAIGLLLATIGAGNIAAAALVGPTAMAVAGRTGIPSFLMAIMVAHGAVAGALSPISPTGIIASQRMQDAGLTGGGWQTYGHNLFANAVVALAGYLAFGGWKLFLGRRTPGEALAIAEGSLPGRSPFPHFEVRHWVTLVVIGAMVVGVITTPQLPVGMAALVGAAALSLTRLSDEQEAVRRMPWGVIVMVCGVTMLTSLLALTGGMDRMTDLVASVSGPRSVTGVVALVAGLVSVYSSTSGVVLPVFLPMVPGLAEKVGGDPLAIAASINVGGHLVDVSPLSTIGAICIAGASAGEDRRVLFNQLLAWGLSMSVVGAGFCSVFFQ